MQNYSSYGHGDKGNNFSLAIKEAYDFFIKRTNIIFIVAINIIIIYIISPLAQSHDGHGKTTRR